MTFVCPFALRIVAQNCPNLTEVVHADLGGWTGSVQANVLNDFKNNCKYLSAYKIINIDQAVQAREVDHGCALQ